VAEEPPALPLSFGQRVPAPKPPQAEPEPMAPAVLGATRSADVNMDDGPFIAPAASRPEKDRSPLHQPEPMAEAEALNPSDRPAKRKGRGFSLFRRKQASQAAVTVPPAPAQPRLESPSPERMRQAVALEAPADNVAETPAPAMPAPATPAPAIQEPVEPVQTAAPAPAEPEQKPEEPPLAPPQTEEDLLEIPSFLRRQAN